MQNDCLQYYTRFGFTIDQDNKKPAKCDFKDQIFAIFRG